MLDYGQKVTRTILEKFSFDTEEEKRQYWTDYRDKVNRALGDKRGNVINEMKKAFMSKCIKRWWWWCCAWNYKQRLTSVVAWLVVACFPFQQICARRRKCPIKRCCWTPVLTPKYSPSSAVPSCGAWLERSYSGRNEEKVDDSDDDDNDTSKMGEWTGRWQLKIVNSNSKNTANVCHPFSAKIAIVQQYDVNTVTTMMPYGYHLIATRAITSLPCGDLCYDKELMVSLPCLSLRVAMQAGNHCRVMWFSMTRYGRCHHRPALHVCIPFSPRLLFYVKNLYGYAACDTFVSWWGVSAIQPRGNMDFGSESHGKILGGL